MPKQTIEVRVPTRMEHLSYLTAIETNYRHEGNILAAQVIAQELEKIGWQPPRSLT